MDLKVIVMAVVLDIALADNSQNEDTFHIPINKMHGSNYATVEDVERIANALLFNISAIFSGQGQVHKPERNEETKMRDCNDVKNQGHNVTGIYTIYPGLNANKLSVRCDMDTAKGGWTVIQRRVSYSDFYKTWDEYKNGFGNLSTNFWLGNDNIHTIMSQCRYELRIDLTSPAGETAYAEYSEFSIGDCASGYRLLVSGYSGNAGDSLIPRGNGMKFSTFDRDNDVYSDNCAVLFHGSWWYDACHTSNLNGNYGNAAYAMGPVWEPWKGYYVPMKMTEMKIRRFE